jgi:hypothetical protein
MEAADADPDIPTEYLIEIGRVSTRWGILESTIDLCLMNLAGKDILDPRSLIIFNHMAFPMKIDVMGALVSQLQPTYPDLSGFPPVLQLLKQAQEQRNRVVHSKWGSDEPGGQVTISRLTARGKLKTSVTPISVEEVRAAADLITKAAHDLYILVVKAGTTNTPPHTGQ